MLEFGMGCCYENLHELQAVIPFDSYQEQASQES